LGDLALVVDLIVSLATKSPMSTYSRSEKIHRFALNAALWDCRLWHVKDARSHIARKHVALLALFFSLCDVCQTFVALDPVFECLNVGNCLALSGVSLKITYGVVILQQ